jgi:hypothetical protein
MDLSALHWSIRDQLWSDVDSPTTEPVEPDAIPLRRMSAAERAAVRSWRRTRRRADGRLGSLVAPSSMLLMVWMGMPTAETVE